MPDTAVERTVTRDVVTSRPPSGDVTRTVTGLTPGLRVWTREADLVGAGLDDAIEAALRRRRTRGATSPRARG